MENAVIYARYSSHNQSEQSIEGQLSAAHKYAVEKGYNIIHEYCDRAKTGTNDNREEFQRMLSDVRKQKFSVIIVWKVDRFGRNREEITFNKHKCKKYGARVEYVAENITDGPEGVILESVLEGMAEYYSLQLSQNVRRGQLEAAKKHHVLSGHITYGYKMGPDKKYQIDPDKAPIVRTIFNNYANGYTITELQKWAEDHGIRSKKGNPLSKTFFSKMLSNERYIGVYLFKNIIREEDVIPPIIDRNTFARVQIILKQNRRMPSHRWSYSEYILTGKLFCSCGSPMVGESGYSRMNRKYHYYKCLKRKRGMPCNCKPVPRNNLEAVVIEKAIAVISNKDFVEKLCQKVVEYSSMVGLDSQSIYSRRSENITAAIANLTKAVEEGMPYELVRSRLEQLRQEEASLKISQASPPVFSSGVPDEVTISHIHYFMRGVYNKSEGQELDSIKRELVETLVNRIEMHKDHLVVAMNYSNDLRPVEEIRMCPQLQGIEDDSRICIQDNVFIINITNPTAQ